MARGNAVRRRLAKRRQAGYFRGPVFSPPTRRKRAGVRHGGLQMKALVKSKAEPGIWLQDVPEPSYGIDDVLIKVLKTGICGTDVHIYNWDEWAQKTIKPGTVAGHEFVGRIAAGGSNVHGHKVGDLVSAEGHIVCGHCRHCLPGRRHLCANTLGVGVNRDGAFAEYVVVPAPNIWHCDPHVPLEIYAIFDPLGNAAHTALSYDLVGEDVLITGAGPSCPRATPTRGSPCRALLSSSRWGSRPTPLYLMICWARTC